MTKNMKLILTSLSLLFFLSGCVSMGPLSQAAVDNDIEKIKTLVAKGTNVNELDKTAYIYWTALWCAVDSRNHEAVKTLLELGADPNINSSYYGASESSNSYGYGALGNYRFVGSPLMAAVLEEDTIVVEMLLKAGANPKALAEEAPVDSSPGMDPLGYGAMNGNLAIATLLLNYGADVNLKYPNNAKAAYEAMARGYVDYVILLVENGLEIDSDTLWAHYNSEIAHLAADHYASSNEEKAIQFYKKASELYPQGIKNYKGIAGRYGLKEDLKTILSVASVAFGAYAAQHNAQMMANDTGTFGVGTYTTLLYKSDMTNEELYNLKAQTSQQNYNICETILTCHENHEGNMTLVDCAENAKESYKDLNIKE